MRRVDDHRFVFLAGLHRSGTTLLARLLAAHPDVSGFSGTGVDADEGQHLQTVYPAAKIWGGPGRFGFAPEAHFTEEKATEEKARKLYEEWAPHWDLARPLLLEKSPPNLLKTRFLQALFPGSSFVVVLRHPIAVSLATAKWRKTRRLGRLLDHWLRCHEIFEADKPKLERVHVIRYEDLVREPEPVLRGVFEFLELNPIPPSEPVEAGADERYFAQWQSLKRDLRMRAYLDLSEARYERRARRFGYTLFRPGR
jgi:hypothetical protein